MDDGGPMIQRRVHWPVYIPYTGWYNACEVNDVGAPGVQPRTILMGDVTCRKCRWFITSGGRNGEWN